MDSMKMDDALFRPEALEALREPEQIGRAMQLAPAPYRTLLLAVGLAVLTALIASAFIKVPIMVAATGTILPASASLENVVVAQYEGQLTALLFHDGDIVPKAAVVATVSQPALENDLHLAQDENAAATERLADLQSLQKLSLDTLAPLQKMQAADATASIARLDQRQAQLTQLAAGTDRLRAAGFITSERYLTVTQQLSEAQDAIAAKRASLLALQTDWAEKTFQFARETAELREKVAQTGRQVARLKAQVAAAEFIRAPQGGRVAEIKLSPGDLVRFNSPVMGLLPLDAPATVLASDPLMAMALVPASDGKKVRPGDTVFIDPASVRRDVYGQVKGRVVSISSNPVTPDLLRNILRNDDLVKKMTEAGPAFLASVAMQRDPRTPTGYAWTSSRGPDGTLTAGTPLHAEIQTEQVSLLGLLLPALRQMLRGGGAA